MKNPFLELEKNECVLYAISLIAVIGSSFFGNVSLFSLVSTVTGVTALIFTAKGNVWGQVFSLLFAVFYGLKSYSQRYYGEAIISAVLMIPLAIFSLIAWLKNPFKKGENVVKIHRLSVKEKTFLVISSVVVFFVFNYVLKLFDTPNLLIASISVLTSYFASFLLVKRNPYYAIAYSLNDIVLIVLWLIACFLDTSNIPVVVCFVMFLFNDLYGFICWKKREKYQLEVEQRKC